MGGYQKLFKKSTHAIPLANGKTATVELQEEGGKILAIRWAAPEHMLQRPRGWAFSIELVNLLKEWGVDEIWVYCGEEVWRCSMELFLVKSFPIERGFGSQLVLPIKFWAQGRQDRTEAKANEIKEKRFPLPT